MMSVFQTEVMSLQRDGAIIARDLPVQRDNVNIPMELLGRRDIPVNQYDLYSLGWVSPVPEFGDYFINQADGTMYQVYGNAAATFVDHVEVRVTRYLGKTP